MFISTLGLVYKKSMETNRIKLKLDKTGIFANPHPLKKKCHVYLLIIKSTYNHPNTHKLQYFYSTL